MATTMQAEQSQFQMDPFADFNHQLRVYLSGAVTPNVVQDLIKHCALIAQRDEAMTFEIVRNVAQARGIDLGKIKTSDKALRRLIGLSEDQLK